MWRIENLELAEVQPNMHGQFYGGDCYLVLYTYRVSNREQYILYMWQVSFIRKVFPTLSSYRTNKPTNPLFVLIYYLKSFASGTSCYQRWDHSLRLPGCCRWQYVQRSPCPGPSGDGKGASPLPGYFQRKTHHLWGVICTLLYTKLRPVTLTSQGESCGEVWSRVMLLNVIPNCGSQITIIEKPAGVQVQ